MQNLQALSATSGRYSVSSQILRPQNIQSHSLARLDSLHLNGFGGLWKQSSSLVLLAHGGKNYTNAGVLFLQYTSFFLVFATT